MLKSKARSRRTPYDADTFVVTGAASGIGRRLVGDLLARGHRAMATDLRADALDRTAEEDRWPTDRVLLRNLDVRHAQGWESLLDEALDTWGTLDCLLNVAGFLRPAWVHEATEDDIHRHLDINVKGVVLGTRAAARRMIGRQRGHIINIASLASMAPAPGLGLYVGSKYAVRGFSMAAAQELKQHGVAVTTVCPDAVATPMLDLQVDYPEAALTFTAPRVLEPSDVSTLILDKVLRRRPILVSIPKRRAALARMSDLFPQVAGLLTRLLASQGDRVRREFRS